MTICETKLDSTIVSTAIGLPNMTIFRSDRNRNGGGLATYVKTSVKATQLTEMETKYSGYGLELLIVKLTTGSNDIILIAVYRPPHIPADSFFTLQELLLEADQLGKIVLMGDLNADFRSANANSVRTLISILNTCNLQLPNSCEATRLSTTTATCLDIICPSSLFRINSYQIISNAASDHMPVSISMETQIIMRTLKPIRRRCYKNLNWNELNDKLRSRSIGQHLNLDIDDICNQWYSGLNALLDEMAPFKDMPWRRKSSPFVTTEIKRLMVERDNLIRKNRNKPLPEQDWDRLRVLKRKVTSQLRQKAKEEGMNSLNSNNPKDSWKFINKMTFTNKKSENYQLIEPETLNDYFANVVTSNCEPGLLPIEGCNNLNSFSFRPITNNEVSHAITKMKLKNSPGHDNLPSYIIKRLNYSISVDLTLIFNKCIETSCFPICWKASNIISVWKNKGSRTDPSNFRPISILPLLGRIFEKLLAHQLNSYCEAQNIIPIEQFGFRKNSSCETALLKLCNDFMESVDKGKMVGALLIDLSKAFDMVSHQKLLAKFQEINMSSDSIELFRSYLSDRKQRVVCNSSITRWMNVSRGVPQGSCLSPLLFNIYVYDLPAAVDLDIYQYADDITESATADNVEEITNNLVEGFKQTQIYCNSLDLQVNATKTQFIMFKQPTKKLPMDLCINLDDTPIPVSSSVKLLGFILDRHLTFGPHIDSTVVKARGILQRLRQASKWLPQELMKLAYISLVRSHLEYCSAVFSGAAETHNLKLDTVQKIAARLICNASRDTHAEPLLQKLGLDKLKDRRKAHVTDVVKSILDGQSHPTLSSILCLNDSRTEITLPSTRTKIGFRRFAVQAALCET